MDKTKPCADCVVWSPFGVKFDFDSHFKELQGVEDYFIFNLFHRTYVKMQISIRK